MEDSKARIRSPEEEGGAAILESVVRGLEQEEAFLRTECEELRAELAAKRAEAEALRRLLVEASIKTQRLDALRCRAPCPLDEEGRRASLFIIKYCELELLREREGNLIGGFGE